MAKTSFVVHLHKRLEKPQKPIAKRKPQVGETTLAAGKAAVKRKDKGTNVGKARKGPQGIVEAPQAGRSNGGSM